jgi:hypothetical protein
VVDFTGNLVLHRSLIGILIKPSSFLGGFKFPHSNWHENIEKYVYIVFPLDPCSAVSATIIVMNNYPKTPSFDIQNAQRLAVSSPSWLLLLPFAYTTCSTFLLLVVCKMLF